MEPAEKRPLRSRFGCRRRAPSERRRLRPSRGTIIHGPVHDSPAGRLVAPRPLLSWWLRRVEPVEKRPLRFRFGCRGRAPSERRRLKPSRGVIIGGPVHDSPTKGLVASRPLLGWRPRWMQPAEKRPLVLPLRMQKPGTERPSSRLRLMGSKDWRSGSRARHRGSRSVAQRVAKGSAGACIFAWRSSGK